MGLMVAPPPPRAVYQPRRRNHDLVGRAALVKPLLDLLDKQGSLTHADLRWLANAIDRSERTVQRMLDEALVLREDRRAAITADAELVGDSELLPYEFLVLAAKHGGNVAAAIREWKADARSPRLPGTATVYRWLEAQDPALKRVLRKGPSALDGYLEVGVYMPQYRNEEWQADEMHLPVRARGPRNTILDDLWLFVIIEVWSRLVVAAAISVGPATAEFAAAVFWNAVLGWRHERIVVAGSPDTILTDHGWIFKRGTAWRAAVAAAGSTAELVPPYTPQAKPVVERWNRSHVLTTLTGIGGMTGGPVGWTYELEAGPDGELRRKRVEAPLLQLPDGQLPTLREVSEISAKGIERYNLSDVHSTIKSTPIVRYASSDTFQRQWGAGAAWDHAIAASPHQIHARGLHFHDWWDVPGLAAPTQADVRYLPGFRPHVLAGVNGRFRTEAVPQADVTQERVEERHANNHRRLRFARGLFVDARRELGAKPGDAAVSKEPARGGRGSRRRNSNQRRLGDPDAALTASRNEIA